MGNFVNKASRNLSLNISPTGFRWNFKSRATALIRSFSNVTLRKTGSSSCNAIYWRWQISCGYHEGWRFLNRDQSCSLPFAFPSEVSLGDRLHLPRENNIWGTYQFSTQNDQWLHSHLVPRWEKVVVPNLLIASREFCLGMEFYLSCRWRHSTVAHSWVIIDIEFIQELLSSV